MKSLLSALTLLILSACHDPSATTTTTGASAVAHEATEAPSAPIYPLRLSLRDQHDATLSLDAYRGHPVIISMFYGSCPSACPLIVAHVKQLEAKLPPAVREQTRVLLVSFDPDRDTPAALRAMAERHHALDPRWTFAVGSDDDVRQLANVLGVVYRKESTGSISHNSVIGVLDGEGRITARIDEPNADLTPLARATISAAH
jgi:protein SCO1/2